MEDSCSGSLGDGLKEMDVDVAVRYILTFRMRHRLAVDAKKALA